MLFNHDIRDFEIKRGDRIAQLICEKYQDVNIEEVSRPDAFSSTQRGSNGFGSTDTK